MTLQELLLALGDLDNAQNVEIDPQTIVEDLKDKVDAIYTVVERLQGESARLAVNADRFKTASKQIEKQAERLKDYVAWNMEQQGFEKLPGINWKIQLQKSVEVKAEREPVAEDALEFPDLVRRKISYSWDKTAIKEYWKKGGIFIYAHTVLNKSCRFYINKGEGK